MDAVRWKIGDGRWRQSPNHGKDQVPSSRSAGKSENARQEHTRPVEARGRTRRDPPSIPSQAGRSASFLGSPAWSPCTPNWRAFPIKPNLDNRSAVLSTSGLSSVAGSRDQPAAPASPLQPPASSNMAASEDQGTAPPAAPVGVEDKVATENAAVEQTEVDEAEQAAEGTSDDWRSMLVPVTDTQIAAVPNWRVLLTGCCVQSRSTTSQSSYRTRPRR
ncbi:uncharacterized protein SPSK_09331 [Sporothrix schenckii 1099-18]|uniref:Uncharacterized protein n=1 Tax=Sporothrix schenckii 1099-18 TaxID=1397361 RepID=A0A0F2MA55_SPOSC|nr:uncharacterized protein SPSK_09331 [Sporothrix schenckii 1099-18]KJR85954.1 hypothetical protein SPSK_09331 [Sporothrix schenckii 1099-18]